jgi:hypothetical protein
MVVNTIGIADIDSCNVAFASLWSTLCATSPLLANDCDMMPELSVGTVSSNGEPSGCFLEWEMLKVVHTHSISIQTTTTTTGE